MELSREPREAVLRAFRRFKDSEPDPSESSLLAVVLIAVGSGPTELLRSSKRGVDFKRLENGAWKAKSNVIRTEDKPIMKVTNTENNCNCIILKKLAVY